ncbi:MAG: PhoH family protein [Candidatus Omnitrophica bacterium]|nr:PhoH family protein [Candidatus Omnitrophota bacterium]MDD5671354.1 PhoH family protein [Candidatus Omnitrophota bacterium]
MDKLIKLNSNEEAIALYGSLDENLRFAEKEYGVRISARNYRLKISGDKKNVDAAHLFFQERLKEIRGGGRIAGEHGHEKVQLTENDLPETISFYHRGKTIRARSKNQELYLKAIQVNDVVVGIGPAGTGKTYLAMASAIDFLKRKRVSRIVLTRPAVEAGESLGFLPGDLYAKINPYLRPLYDALYDMLDYDEATRYLERGVIEVAPLAYMRGRTLNDSFIILDEAQNCTHAQMKMFLTRLGESSRAVVTGDITQIDLPAGKVSGLVESKAVLANILGIQFVFLHEVDVVRHPLVQAIIRAYEKYER